MKRHAIIVLLLPALLMACQTQDEPVDASAAGPAEVVRAAAMQMPHADPDEHLLYHPDAIDWQPAPASLEEGAEVAILEGDPGAEELFTMRIKMPDGFHISPHWHPNYERVTVVSGAFLLGHGEELDRASVERLVPGSYAAMPPEMRHYAIADGETVVQLTSIGPWEINYVDEADDPRLREPAR